MKAVCWCKTGSVRVEYVPDPKIINPRDAIIRVRKTAICGSDLHLFGGCIPGMQAGDILGHEFMGEVVELGPGVRNLEVGDRVVVPFAIACGGCFFCQHQLWSLCDNSNPNAGMLEELYGYSSSGLFGYSHLYGGYAGGQAEYVRVPFADVGPVKVPETVTDEQAVFLADVFPTGYMAAENCNIQPGDTVAVWGCGPVGLCAMRSAYWLGAERVIAIDRFPDRLRLAASFGLAETLNYADEDVFSRLKEMTHGRGPDACIDAVGMEAHGTSLDARYDQFKHALYLATDRPHVLRQAIHACRKGGTVSIPGVYGGVLDKLPFGAAFGKGLTMKMGQTHVHRYIRPLAERLARGEADPSQIVSHRGRLDDAPACTRVFVTKRMAAPKSCSPLPEVKMLDPAFNGGLAGLLATVPMTAAMKLLHRQLPIHERQPLPPRTITMRVAQRANVAQYLDARGRKAATIASHFSYGTAMGALYGMCCGSNRNARVGHGVLFGLIVWAVSYLGLLPGLGLLSPATRHPPRRTALMIAVHLVWGAALGLLTPRLQTGRPDS